MALSIYKWQGQYLRRQSFLNSMGLPGWALHSRCCCDVGCGCNILPEVLVFTFKAPTCPAIDGCWGTLNLIPTPEFTWEYNNDNSCQDLVTTFIPTLKCDKTKQVQSSKCEQYKLVFTWTYSGCDLSPLGYTFPKSCTCNPFKITFGDYTISDDPVCDINCDKPFTFTIEITLPP